jgi:type II secretory pathway pseudopilin PulG
VAARFRQQGFSLLEMMIACGILMFGVVSVVQLVPASLKNSTNNRLDTMATAIAQRELDQMLSQPLTVTSFLDIDSNRVSLGGPGATGADVVMDGLSAAINFSQDVTSVPVGFSTFYVDAADPKATAFELRWAVYSEMNGTTVVGRRILVGCRRANSNSGVFPVTLDSSVQKFGN